MSRRIIGSRVPVVGELKERSLRRRGCEDCRCVASPCRCQFESKTVWEVVGRKSTRRLSKGHVAVPYELPPSPKRRNANVSDQGATWLLEDDDGKPWTLYEERWLQRDYSFRTVWVDVAALASGARSVRYEYGADTGVALVEGTRWTFDGERSAWELLRPSQWIV